MDKNKVVYYAVMLEKEQKVTFSIKVFQMEVPRGAKEGAWEGVAWVMEAWEEVAWVMEAWEEAPWEEAAQEEAAWEEMEWEEAAWEEEVEREEVLFFVIK
jgi:hypothetical protein